MFNGAHRERVRFAINKRVKGNCWVTFPNGSEDVLGCVVDTGADGTAIPQAFWSQFFTKEEVVALPPAKPIRGVGGSIDVREVQLPLRISGLNFQDDQPFDLGTCKVWLALDGDAGKPMKQVLLGVGGCLEKGGLCINWKTNEAYYVEVDDLPAQQ